MEVVEPLLLVVEVPLLLGDLVVFIEEVEPAATIHLVDLVLLLLTAHHRAALQALLPMVAAGLIFTKFVKV